MVNLNLTLAHAYLTRAASRAVSLELREGVAKIIMEGDPDAVPEEIEETCVQCHEALAAVDKILKPVLAVSRTQMEDRVDCSSHQ